MQAPLRARYDAREDRMLLMLHPADGEPRAFWVTRRQWLELLHALRAIAVDQAAEETRLPQEPRTAGPKLGETVPAMPVQAIRLRPMPEGIRLAFIAPPQGATLTLQTPGIPRLIDMLFQQCERAEWDPNAALARLDARDITGETISKVRRKR